MRGDLGAYPMSEGSSPRGDAASTASGFTAASVSDAVDAPPAAGLGPLGPDLGQSLGRRAPSTGGVAGSSSSEFGEIEAEGPMTGGAAGNNGAPAAMTAATAVAAAAAVSAARPGLHQVRNYLLNTPTLAATTLLKQKQ